MVDAALPLDVPQIAEPDAVTPTDRRQIVWSSVIGTTVEWYDFLIYGTASALVFNKLFFPSIDPAVGTIAAFGSYAVGFLARPLGGAVFGHFGDRVGRKAMLSLTLMIMGLGTFLIGCLPTYGQIGILAPILLVALRLVQGIGIGGEWGGAVLMVVESVPAERRGFFGSVVQLGYPIGVILSIGAFALTGLMPEAAFLSWGWRIPFLASAPLVGVGLFIRLRLHETPAFRRIKARAVTARLPALEILTEHPGMFLKAVGLKVSEIAYVSIVTVFSISYVTGQLGLSRGVILNGILVAALIELFTIPAFGWLSDRYGRRPLFIAACLFSIAFAFPMFRLLDTRDPTIITLTVAVALSFGQGIMFGTGAAWMSELFDARLRYSGASLGFQVGAALSGGFTPLIAAALLAWSGGATWPISAYLIALACVTLAATFAAPETARRRID
ncbi:MFS transporter, MHS family, shikimate and dehydroshikimate transport protein [Methylobacterium phyllostachyos]|uniref:MFS transporter, MHS family, shikimate and dehydroshikimate transport protein n=1 Tax=Methylobacterium phyllostachyos TaxID=582672 RepID=A0A1H0I6V5_9HYPH|nr:MFS transporter [Methylobacterium phyllostachyos]SDO27168.1 MFS transporter, MHS family, shikimate and dehydroshikimate transport protein [Methylobacterium phyllostachyos]